MARVKNKTIIISVTTMIMAILICGVSIKFYWENLNENNQALGEQIAADLIKEKSRDKKELKFELEKKYQLDRNDDVRIILIEKDNGKNADVLVNIYQKPLGPFSVFSQEENEWSNEE